MHLQNTDEGIKNVREVGRFSGRNGAIAHCRKDASNGVDRVVCIGDWLQVDVDGSTIPSGQ